MEYDVALIAPAAGLMLAGPGHFPTHLMVAHRANRRGLQRLLRDRGPPGSRERWR